MFHSSLGKCLDMTFDSLVIRSRLDPMVGHMDQLKTGLHAFLTSYTDKYGVFPSHPTHKHSQSVRDSRTLHIKVTIFPAGGAPGGISDRAQRKAQTTKQAPIPIVKAIMMSLGHSYDDLRARNRAPQPLLGGVI